MHLKNIIFMFICSTLIKETGKGTAADIIDYHISATEGQQVTLPSGFSAAGYPDQSNKNISWTFDNTTIAYVKPGETPWIINQSLFVMKKNKDLIIRNMMPSLNGEYKQVVGNKTIVKYVVEIPAHVIIVRQTYNEKTIGKITRGEWGITFGFDELTRRESVCDIAVYALTVSLCSKPPNDTSNSCENRPATVEKTPGVCEVKIQYNYPAKRNTSEKLYVKFIHDKIQLFPLTMENKGEVTPSYPTQGITTPQTTNSMMTPTSMKRSTSDMTASVPPTSSAKKTPTNSVMTPTSTKRSRSDMTASVPPVILPKNTPSGLSTLGIIRIVLISAVCTVVLILAGVIIYVIRTRRHKQSFDDNGENQNGPAASSPTRLNSPQDSSRAESFGMTPNVDQT